MRNLRLVHSRAWLEHPNIEPPRDPHLARVELELPPLHPAVLAILAHVRIGVPPPLPQLVRARVLARARAAMATPHR